MLYNLDIKHRVWKDVVFTDVNGTKFNGNLTMHYTDISSVLILFPPEMNENELDKMLFLTNIFKDCYRIENDLKIVELLFFEAFTILIESLRFCLPSSISGQGYSYSFSSLSELESFEQYVITSLGIGPPPLPSFYKIERFAPRYAPILTKKIVSTILLPISANDSTKFTNMMRLFQLSVDPAQTIYDPTRQIASLDPRSSYTHEQLADVLQTQTIPIEFSLKIILKLLDLPAAPHIFEQYGPDYLKIKRSFFSVSDSQLKRSTQLEAYISKISQNVTETPIPFEYPLSLAPMLSQITFNVLAALFETDTSFLDYCDITMRLFYVVLFIVFPIPTDDGFVIRGGQLYTPDATEAILFWILLKIAFRSDFFYLIKTPDPFDDLRSFLILSNPFLYDQIKDSIGKDILPTVMSLFADLINPVSLVDLWLVGLSTRSMYEYIISTVAGCLITAFNVDGGNVASDLIAHAVSEKGSKYITALGLLINERAKSLRAHSMV